MRVLKMSWRQEKLKIFNCVETCQRGRRVWLGRRREKKHLNRKGHVYDFDWLSRFSSHFIFELNYFIAN
jgi:hypothetical protein